MASTDAALWRQRMLRFALGGSPPVLTAAFGVVRNKWLALNLETLGLGVLAQVVSGQVWFGTATGLGLQLPVARAIGTASASGDAASMRRIGQTALTLVAAGVVGAVALGLVAAPFISQVLLGSSAHSGLVRISMVGVVGCAFLGVFQGMFAGRSDVRAAATVAIAGGATALVVTLILVPRFGLTGGMIGAALLFPASVAGALLVHRCSYARALGPIRRFRFDPGVARGLVRVGGAALVLALLDQGSLIAIRSHYLRENGISANGLLQAALSISQQVGGLFHAYLANYAFGKISGESGIEGVRAYTRRHWQPLMLAAALALGAAMILSRPLLHLLFSSRFDAARPMMAWAMVGEFARVGVQLWALGALPLGGVRLWMPIGLWSSAAFVLVYVAIVPARLGSLSLPIAYLAGNLSTLGFTGVWMSRRGLTLGWADVAVAVVALAGLLTIAFWVAGG